MSCLDLAQDVMQLHMQKLKQVQESRKASLEKANQVNLSMSSLPGEIYDSLSQVTDRIIQCTTIC